MKILQLDFNNFISYGKQTLDLSNIKIASIIGENGSGKSSILEGITYALFGVSRAKTDDGLVKIGTEKMYVQIKFIIDNKEFTIKRIKHKGKSSKLQILEGINDISGTTITESQSKIEKILNSNYDTFINSAFIPQGRFDEFIRKTSAEKNKIFMSFLGIEKYTELEEIAKQKTKNIEMEVSFREGRSLELNSIIEGAKDIEAKKKICDLSIGSTKKSITAFEQKKETIQKKTASLQAQVDNSMKNTSLYETIYKELSNLNMSYENKIKKLHCSTEEASTLYKKYKDQSIDVDKKLIELNKKVQSLSNESSVIYSQSNELNKKKNKFNGLEGTCYVCGSVISKEQVNHMCVDLDKELSALTPKLKQIEEEFDLLKVIIIEHEDFKLLIEIREIDIKIGEKQEQLSNIVKPESLDYVKEELITLENDIDKINYDIGTYKNTISTNERVLGSLLEQEKNRDKAIKEVGENASLLTQYKKDLTSYRELIKAFSKKGIPSLIIENSLPLIENEANRLLDRFGSNLKIEFIKVANKNESLELQVKDIEGFRDINMYSGGEKIRIALAIRIALSRILMLRNDAKIGLFVIDEPTDLDEAGMTDLINILNVLSKEFEQIFVISHIDTLINAFSTTLFISKTNEGSSILVKQQ